MNQLNYIEKNKLVWNERTKVHIKSEFYNHEEFLKGATSLKEIELGLLGDINGKKILHLQCHFGQDSLSLARMGAQVTGIDLSDEAIKIAKETATKLNLDATFICCNIYDLPRHLHEEFDLVFTSYGTIGWLYDLQAWANIVSRFLKPEGQFIFVEFHPFVWMYDNDLKNIVYTYFQSEEIVELDEGTYADTSAKINMETITWNHAMSDVIQQLLNHQLELISVKEYNYSPYNVFPNCIEASPSKFQVSQWGNKVPMVYSLVMKKRSN